MGYPKLSLPQADPPTVRQLFERYCYLLGVNEPERVAALWAAEVQAMGATRGAQH